MARMCQPGCSGMRNHAGVMVELCAGALGCGRMESGFRSVLITGFQVKDGDCAFVDHQPLSAHSHAAMRHACTCAQAADTGSDLCLRMCMQAMKNLAAYTLHSPADTDLCPYTPDDTKTPMGVWR